VIIGVEVTVRELRCRDNISERKFEKKAEGVY
jgi:hypothetical protein